MKVPATLDAYYEMARRLYQTGPSHDFSHIERVFKLALEIGSREGADLRVLGLAALLHDLAREEEAASGGEVCHAAASAVQAREILTERAEDAAMVSQVAECIATHRFRDQKQPQTLEGQCLYDADKLDSMGAVGIARAYLWLGEHGGVVYEPVLGREPVGVENSFLETDSLQREWLLKLRFLKEKLYTATAREMAVKRAATMEWFLQTLEREVCGKE
jgi:uncharacterized protein